MRDRQTPDHRDSLTEEDTARAAVHKTRIRNCPAFSGGAYREAESDPDAQGVTLAG